VRLLLDTHTLLWSADDPSKLSPAADAALKDPANDLLLSAATVWELAIKVGLGKLTLSMPYRKWMETAIADLHLSILPVTVEYAERLSVLPPHHNDPFDRLTVAEALVAGIPVVGTDAAFDAYGVTRIW
jgi:PIN domain nuclease of toxin-antitoxin system